MSTDLPTFVADNEGTWQEVADLVDGARGSVGRLTPADVRRLGRLYRQVAADLALARRRFPGDPITVRLEALVRRTRPLLYGTVRERESVLEFVTTGYWRRVLERPVFLAIAALLLLGPTIGVGVWAHGSPTEAGRVAQVSELTAGLAEGGPRDADQAITDPAVNTAFSAQIFTNNARVALIAFAGGLTGGVLTLVSLAFNGLILGLVGGLAIEGGHSDSLYRLVVPHGVLELSLIITAGAAGLRTGWALVHPGHRTRSQALAVEGRAGVELALGSAALLVPCGIVEGFVTPRGLPVGGALAVGIGLGVAYWALVAWRGRAPRPAARPA